MLEQFLARLDLQWQVSLSDWIKDRRRPPGHGYDEKWWARLLIRLC